MNLRQQAATDLQAIVEDGATGFGWPITVTAPSGASATLVGFSSDIGQTLDPQTGQAIAARKASVVLRIASLTAAGLTMPRGVDDEGSRPWVVAFADINGAAFTFKVTEAMPDRAIGCVVCVLEAYRLAVHAPGAMQVNPNTGNVQANTGTGNVQTGQ